MRRCVGMLVFMIFMMVVSVMRINHYFIAPVYNAGVNRRTFRGCTINGGKQVLRKFCRILLLSFQQTRRRRSRHGRRLRR